MREFSEQAARKLGTLPDGRRVFRVPYQITTYDDRTLSTIVLESGTIIAESATHAANHLRDEYATRAPNIEIKCKGPRLGLISRFIGYESHIMARLMDRDPNPPRQITFLPRA